MLITAVKNIFENLKGKTSRLIVSGESLLSTQQSLKKLFLKHLLATRQ